VIAVVIGIRAIDRNFDAEYSAKKRNMCRTLAEMKQDHHPIKILRDEFERAKRLRLSPHIIDRQAKLPVDLATVYRWLRGERQPGIDRIYATIEAVRGFVDREEDRVGRRAHTQGGPIELDNEFRTVTRDEVVVGLKGQEFELLTALCNSKRTLCREWLCETYDIPPKSFDRALSELKRKLKKIDKTIIRRFAVDGEAPGYVLSDLVEDDRKVSA
jgi:DNA-binding response OmpR family regulator